MQFNNINDVLDWMIEHPHKRIYDEYANYSIYVPESNIIEYFYYTGEWEDEDGNYEPSNLDMNKYTKDEFVDYFKNTNFETA